MRDKYANKTPLMRFLHMNTGFIVAGLFLVTIVILWVWYDSTLSFFERFTCPQITDYAKLDEHHDLSFEDHIKFHEMLDACFDRLEFIGDKNH